MKSKQRNDTPNSTTLSKQTSMPPPPPTSNPAQSSLVIAIPSVYSPSPSKKLPRPRDDPTRVAVATRDHGCVVLDVAEDMCVMSHIIPAALLRVRPPLRNANKNRMVTSVQVHSPSHQRMILAFRYYCHPISISYLIDFLGRSLRWYHPLPSSTDI